MRSKNTVSSKGSVDNEGNERSCPVLVLAAFWFCAAWVVILLLCGNFYVNKFGLVKGLPSENLEPQQIVDIDRGIVHWTRVTVQTENNHQRVLCIDSNFGFFYKKVDCDHDSLFEGLGDPSSY